MSFTNSDSTARPLIGWGNWNCGECDQTGHKLCTRTYYFFFAVNSESDYRECDTPAQ